MIEVVGDLVRGPVGVGRVEVEGLVVALRLLAGLALALGVHEARVDALGVLVRIDDVDSVGEVVGEREEVCDRVEDAVPDEERDPVVDREDDRVEDSDRRAERVAVCVCPELTCAVLDRVAVDVLDAETDAVGDCVTRLEGDVVAVTV